MIITERATRIGMQAGEFLHQYQDRRTWKDYNRLSPDQKPHHVGIVADGNARWARQRGLILEEGHNHGTEATVDLVRFFANEGANLSLWGWSTDNWKRLDTSPAEVSNIFRIIYKSTLNLLPELKDKNGRVKWLGRRERFEQVERDLSGVETRRVIPALPEWLSDALLRAEEETKTNTGPIIGLQINYSGADELVRIEQRFNDAKKRGDILQNTPLTRDMYFRFADDEGALGEMDLWVRTGVDTKGVVWDSGYGWRNEHSRKIYTRTLLPSLRPVHMARFAIEYSRTEQRRGGRPAEQVVFTATR